MSAIPTPALSEPSVAEFVATGFKAGVPSRQLLDLASSRYGDLWLMDTATQIEVVSAALDEVPFRFGRRELTLLRLIMDEIERSHGTVSEELISAACLRVSSSNESPLHMLVQVGCSRIRISSAFSDIGCAFS